MSLRLRTTGLIVAVTLLLTACAGYSSTGKHSTGSVFLNIFPTTIIVVKNGTPYNLQLAENGVSIAILSPGQSHPIRYRVSSGRRTSVILDVTAFDEERVLVGTNMKRFSLNRREGQVTKSWLITRVKDIRASLDIRTSGDVAYVLAFLFI
jgi:hypothetical protein